MYVEEYPIFRFAFFVGCGDLGLSLAVPGAQDAVDADNEGRTASFVPFGCHGGGETDGPVTTLPRIPPAFTIRASM